jgi:hypothetical protein
MNWRLRMEEAWTNIVLDEKKNRETLDRILAERMVEHHGDKAHLVALMNLHHEESEGVRRFDWRLIMKFIDEIQGEK